MAKDRKKTEKYYIFIDEELMQSMISESQAFDLMTEYVTELTLGRMPRSLPRPAEFPEELRELAMSIGLLGDTVTGIWQFGEKLARGGLDAQVPDGQANLSVPLRDFRSIVSAIGGQVRRQMEDGLPLITSPQAKPCGDADMPDFDAAPDDKGLDGEAQLWGRTVNGWRYRQLVSAMGQLHIMMLEVDRDGGILYANPPFKTMFPELTRIPYAGDGEPPGSALISYLGTFREYRELLKSNGPEAGLFPVHHELYDPQNDAWYKITTDRIQLAGGCCGLLHMINDISEWKKHEYLLKKTASIDDLTGAYARGAGLLALNEAFDERAVTKTCVAFADVDGLKAINDTYGHAEGDFTLRTVAGVFMSCVRKSDWVIRYGGDEFVIIFRDCTAKTANAAISRMHKKLEEINNTLGKPYRLSFSIGCTLIERGCESVDELMAVADRLMYDEKRKSRPPDCAAAPLAGAHGK